MSDAEARFALHIDSNAAEVVGPAAASLEDLQQAIAGDTAELREMQKALRAMKGQAGLADATVRGLRDQIAAKRAAIGQANAKFVELGGTFRRAGVQTKQTSESTRELAARMQGSAGGAGQLAGKLKGVSSMAVLAAAGAAMVAAAVVAVAAAAVTAIGALTRYAILQGNIRRDEAIRLEGLRHMRYGMLGLGHSYMRTADSASFLQTQIDAVSGSVAIGRDKVAEMSVQLTKMGLRGGNLQAALQGAATTTAVLGESQGQMFMQMAAGAALTGRSVKAMADDVEARLGGLAARQMLSLDVQSKKLKENFSAMFKDVKLESFLKGLNEITKLMGQNEAVGKALKKIFEVMLNPMFDAFERIGPIAKRFFQGMTVGALLLAIVVLNLRNKFRDTFGDKKLFEGINFGNVAFKLGVAVIGSLLAVVAGLGTAVLIASAGFAALVGSITAVTVGAKKMVKGVADAVSALTGIDSKHVGRAIVDGIIGGMLGGVGGVVVAMKSLATSAIQAFKGAIDSRSPSRLFAKIGLTIPEGAAGGVDKGRPLVAASMRRMANPQPFKEAAGVIRLSANAGLRKAAAAQAPQPQEQAPATKRPALSVPLRAPAGGGNTINLTIEKIEIHAGDKKDAQAMADDIVSKIADALEAAEITLTTRGAA